MARRSFTKAGSGEEENVFWVTMSDMLLGLMMVFMTLFAFAMTGFTQTKVQQQQIQSEVAQKLIKNLKAQNINAEVDKVTGQVKISNLELFDVNSYTLSSNGQKYLSKFIPIYVNTIFSSDKLSDKVSNILIQGHTDSQMFKGVASKDEQFIKNMDLSTKRANSVVQYVFKTGYNKKYDDKLTKLLVVEGKSFTEPVLVNGKEDYDKSRRVELKLMVREATGIQDLLIGKK